MGIGSWLQYKNNTVPVKKEELEVSGLSEGKTLRFRVCAINSEGRSDYLLDSNAEGVVIKDPYGKPGPPRSLAVKEVTDKSASLHWEKPGTGEGHFRHIFLLNTLCIHIQRLVHEILKQSVLTYFPMGLKGMKKRIPKVNGSREMIWSIMEQSPKKTRKCKDS